MVAQSDRSAGPSAGSCADTWIDMRAGCDNVICAMSTFQDEPRTEGLAIAGAIGGLLAVGGGDDRGARGHRPGPPGARGHRSRRRAGSWRRAALWAAVLVASVVGSGLGWPLFGVLGLPEIGWFVSLLLWLVLAPIALILLAANVIGAVRHG